jgi:hypothetical protein
MRTAGGTLDTEELERELGATDELVLGTELDVVTTLELLGAMEERELGATELDGTTGTLLGAEDDATTFGWPEQVGSASAPEELPVNPKVVEAPEPKLPL